MVDYRKDGYITGLHQAAILRRSVPTITQRTAYEWLDNMVKEKRRQLEENGIGERDVELWDTACRIGFLLATVEDRNKGLL
jgi:hypothetical protein